MGNSASEHLSEGPQINTLERYLHFRVHCRTTHIASIEVHLNIYWWMDEENANSDVTYSSQIHTMECHLALKRKEILSFITTCNTLSEISQVQKDKYYIVTLPCGLWKSQTYRDREQEADLQKLVGFRTGEGREAVAQSEKLWLNWKSKVYSVASTVNNNNVCCISNLLREYIFNILTIKGKLLISLTYSLYVCIKISQHIL